MVPNKKLLVGAGADKYHYCFNSETGELLNRPSGHLRPIKCLGFSPDGGMLGSGCDDGYVICWDVVKGNQLGKIKGHDSRVSSIAFIGKDVFVTASLDKSLGVVRLRNKEFTVEKHRLLKPASSFALVPESRNVVIGNEDGVFEFSLDTKKTVRNLLALENPVYGMSISPEEAAGWPLHQVLRLP